MTARPRDLNIPNFSGRWCQQDGSLTPLALTFVRRIWQRTGNAPGADLSWMEREADQALLAARQALTEAAQARRDAQEGLAATTALLQQVISLHGQLRNVLERVEEAAIIHATDRHAP